MKGEIEYKPVYFKIGLFKKFKVGYAKTKIYTSQGPAPYTVLQKYHLLKLIIFNPFKKLIKR